MIGEYGKDRFMNIDKMVNAFERGINSEHIFIKENMAKHTTFKVGGTTDIFISPETVEELSHAIKTCKAYDMPYYILGNGSNVLVKDGGYRGVVIQVYKTMDQISIDGDRITAGAGVLLSKLSKLIAKASLEGFEFASGIPGTLGGAIYMNAGAYGGDMSQVIVSADVMDKEGNVITLSNEELKLGYRTSIIQDTEYVILNAVLQCKKGNHEEIMARIDDLNNRRKTKQPLEYASAGSTFKRPEGYYAGKLIMDSGLRGYQIGDAQVSEKHCGFIINRGSASADDIIKLIEHIQTTVADKFQVRLETEVRIIGE